MTEQTNPTSELEFRQAYVVSSEYELVNQGRSIIAPRNPVSQKLPGF